MQETKDVKCSFKHKCKNCKAWNLTMQTTTKTRKEKHNIKKT